jgi:hypothetical protein
LSFEHATILHFIDDVFHSAESGEPADGAEIIKEDYVDGRYLEPVLYSAQFPKVMQKSLLIINRSNLYSGFDKPVLDFRRQRVCEDKYWLATPFDEFLTQKQMSIFLTTPISRR